MEHGGVVGLAESTETRSECSNALIAVNLQIENVDDERVAGFGAFNEEWTGERIVAFREGERVTRLFDGVTEAIEGVGIKDVAGLQAGHRRSNAEDVLYVVERGVILDDVGFGSDRPRLSGGRERAGQNYCKKKVAQRIPPGTKSEVHHTSAGESMEGS